MTVEQDRANFRTHLKKAKRQISQGDARAAEYRLLRASEAAGYLPEPMRRAKLAFIEHRLAEVAILLKDWSTARRRFEEAVLLVDKADKIAYARILRDFGNFERLQNNYQLGLAKTMLAIETLESIDKQTKRLHAEMVVTRGFLARFDLYHPLKRANAIVVLRETAGQLYGYKKKAYELANLRCLADILPVYSIERTRYIQRAVWLNLQLGNALQAGELLALLGGRPSRSIYNFMLR